MPATDPNADTVLVRVPVPRPVPPPQRDQQPRQPQQSQQPAGDADPDRFARVHDGRPHAIIMPYRPLGGDGGDDAPPVPPRAARGRLRLAARQAPEGGLVSRGVSYPGGRFVPDPSAPAAPPPAPDAPPPADEAGQKRRAVLRRLLAQIARKRQAARYGRTVAPEKLTPLRKGGGLSGEYFTDGRYFYKHPTSRPGQVDAEVAASEAMRLLGADVPPAGAVMVGGRRMVRTPFLGEHRTLFDHMDGPPDHLRPDAETAARHGLAGWLVHAADRHLGNHAVVRTPGGGERVVPIDFGEAWTRHAALDSKRPVHPTADQWVQHAADPSLPLPRHVIDHALAHEGKIRALADRGTAGLPEAARREAQALLDRKYAQLRRVREHPRPSLHHLDYYQGNDVLHEGL